MILNLFIVFLILLGIYFIVMGNTASHLPVARQRRHLAVFVLGLIAALVTFIPSPDLFGPDYRFTVSMTQVLFAVDLAPLLLFLGLPETTLLPLQRWDGLKRSLKNPFVVGAASTFILLVWFTPPVFEAASRSLPLWVYKQILFLLCGLLFWWPIAGPLPEWRAGYALQLLYLFIIRLPMTVVAIIFTSANRVIYTARSFSLEICAPSSISDQRTGGLVMWTVGGLFVLVVLMIVFFRWFNTGYAAEESSP